MKNRKYFEFIGDTISSNKFFQLLICFLLIIIIFETITIHKLVKKPPIVIKIDDLGNASVYKINHKDIMSSMEINNFCQHFLSYFIAYNVYTQVDSFNKAFDMMTKECQQKMNQFLVENQIEQHIKELQIKTQINITNISVLEDSSDFIRMKVRGTREEKSYTDGLYYREIVFEDIIVIQKVGRSENNLWGLLVADWDEKVFKK